MLARTNVGKGQMLAILCDVVDVYLSKCKALLKTIYVPVSEKKFIKIFEVIETDGYSSTESIETTRLMLAWQNLDLSLL